MKTDDYEDFEYTKYESAINMLIQQDRIEIRDIKTKLYNISYYVIVSFIAAFVFLFKVTSEFQNPLRESEMLLWLWLLHVGCFLLLGFYGFLYWFYNKHMFTVRWCLHMRELYIKNFEEFKRLHLNPLSNIDSAPKPDFVEKEPRIYLVSVICFYLFVFVVISVKIWQLYCHC
jgi:hypothetical protein